MPSTLVLGAAFLVVPLTDGAVPLTVAAMVLGFGNGIGSGIVMTLGADVSPAVGRPTHLGIWNELADIGTGVGPLILSAVTAVAGLGAGIVASGVARVLRRRSVVAGDPATAPRRLRSGRRLPDPAEPSPGDTGFKRRAGCRSGS